MSYERTRGDWLIDLADSINLLTEPRHVTEHVERTVIDQHVTKSGQVQQRRRQMRVGHTVTLPGLVFALQEAAVPGSADQTGSISASFESRPSADLGPISVLKEITSELATWTRALGIKRETIAGRLHALVSANSTDSQLENLARDAARWVRRARMATGEEAAPITLGDKCPYCGKRGLVITGDLQAGRCTRCGEAWDPTTIGLLADMLRANQEQETMTDPARCWMADCTRLGTHEEHRDHRGRVWTREDRCIGGDGRAGRQLGA